MVVRTQEEILQRFNQADDLFGTQKGDLSVYLEFEHVKPFLKEDFVKQVESGETKWVVSTNPRQEILDYLDFAYDKAEDQRGLSANRSMQHFKTWIWLDDPKFYDEVLPLIEDYTDYGIPALDAISKHYGFTRS